MTFPSMFQFLMFVGMGFDVLTVVRVDSVG